MADTRRAHGGDMADKVWRRGQSGPGKSLLDGDIAPFRWFHRCITLAQIRCHGISMGV